MDGLLVASANSLVNNGTGYGVRKGGRPDTGRRLDIDGLGLLRRRVAVVGKIVGNDDNPTQKTRLSSAA